jgi:hypothetical protein
MTPDGRRAVSWGDDKTLRVWDLESGVCLRILEGPSEGIERVRGVHVMPDGHRALSISSDGALRVWDLESGVRLGVFVSAAPISAFASFSGVLTIGTDAGQVLFVETRNLPPGPPIAADTGDAAYEASLRRGLDLSRLENGPDHKETLAHLVAQAVHLEKIGKTDEARLLREEHDRIDPRVAAQKTQDRKALQMRSELRGAMLLARVAYQFGDYAWVERLLRLMVANCFEVPITRCKLCLVLLIQDRFTEAVTETAAAWEQRAEAPSDVVPRIPWLQLAALYASPGREAGMDSPSAILGRLKTALGREGAHKDEYKRQRPVAIHLDEEEKEDRAAVCEMANEWTMRTVLVHLQPRLSAEQYQLLAALDAALNDATNLPALDQFPAWRDAQPEPL